MPLSARANQTFAPSAHVAPCAGGHSRPPRVGVRGGRAGGRGPGRGLRHRVVRIGRDAGGGAASTPAGTSAASIGTGSTPLAGSSAGAQGTTASPAPAPSCAGRAASSGSGPAPALAAVQFVDSGHGWVAGAGRIMATSDGGGSWTRQYTGHANLDQVDFIDRQHGWAAGGDTLLRTTDGGAQLDGAGRAVPGRAQLGPLRLADRGLRGPRPPPATRRAAPTRTPFGGSLVRTGNGGATWSAVPSARRQPAERLLRQRR